MPAGPSTLTVHREDDGCVVTRLGPSSLERHDQRPMHAWLIDILSHIIVVVSLQIFEL